MKITLYEFRNHWNEFSSRNCWCRTQPIQPLDLVFVCDVRICFVGILFSKFVRQMGIGQRPTATIKRITNYSNYSNCYYCEANDIFQIVIVGLRSHIYIFEKGSWRAKYRVTKKKTKMRSNYIANFHLRISLMRLENEHRIICILETE